MKLMKLSLVLLLAVFTAFAATPQTPEEQEFAGWMKTAQATAGSLRKNIEAKAAEDVTKDAAKMEEVFKKTEEFWTKRKTEDAVKWSQQAHAAAKEVAESAKMGDWEKASTSLRSLMGNCAACHNAHRERLPEGGYKIK
jgi:cytochrome c556